MERTREERIKRHLEANEQIKKVLRKKPLFQENEERFAKDFVLPELE